MTASTIGYRGEIGSRQNRHRPPSLSQPTIGRLSYHLSRFPHLGQWLGGSDNALTVRANSRTGPQSAGSSTRGSR